MKTSVALILEIYGGRGNSSEQNLCHSIPWLMVLCFLCVQFSKWTSLESANNINEVFFTEYRTDVLWKDYGKQALKYIGKQKGILTDLYLVELEMTPTNTSFISKTAYKGRMTCQELKNI